ncbi:MAG: hypothetical protein FWG31_04150 [Oscillospiraceae bacterium]|nr:hypothetical protein [Oscillospiraceae bacterium]
MKKVFSLLLILGCMITVPFDAAAISREDVPGESVYGYASEQDEVYEMIYKSEEFVSSLKFHGVSIVKESIMPTYTADLLQYAETGVFEIVPDVSKKVVDGKTIGDKQWYYVKTASKFGFTGIYTMYVENGAAYRSVFQPTALLEPRNTNVMSFYYADHARRVEKIVGRKVSEADVRFVGISRLGLFFYVNDGEIEVLVPILADDNVFSRDKEMIAVGDELKKVADQKLFEYKEWLEAVEKEQREWEAANPGKERTGAAGNDGTLISHYGINPDDIDDIYTLPEPLANNGEETSPPQASDNIQPNPPESLSTEPDDLSDESCNTGKVIGIIALAAIPAAAVCVFLLKRK